MKVIRIITICASIVLASCNTKPNKSVQFTDSELNFCTEQYLSLFDSMKLKKDFPVSVGKNGELLTKPSDWWTSGFFPGSLWYLFEYTEDFDWADRARIYTEKLDREKNNTKTHDLGFMMYNSYGNGLRLLHDETYKQVLLTSAESLKNRFNPKIGCIKSWESSNKWQYPVIIDNMMNLELLMWAFHETKDSTYYTACTSHADTTLKNHFRNDYSTYHLVSYDTLTSKVQLKQTVQGANDSSAWARGQSWGLYGFTMLYRETRLDRYLFQAINIANFLIKNKSMPADKIPYWDYNAPDIPKAKRDASAAAIMASALIELSGYTKPELSKTYLEFARAQLKSLSTPEYRAQKGENGNFILKHSVGNFPGKSEVDVPLTYADYYYIEALMRLRNKQ